MGVILVISLMLNVALIVLVAALLKDNEKTINEWRNTIDKWDETIKLLQLSNDTVNKLLKEKEEKERISEYRGAKW